MRVVEAGEFDVVDAGSAPRIVQPLAFPLEVLLGVACDLCRALRLHVLLRHILPLSRPYLV